LKSNSLNLTFFLIKNTFWTLSFFRVNMRFAATCQHTSAVLFPLINFRFAFFFIQRTFTSLQNFFLKVNLIYIWLLSNYVLIWCNIEVFLSRSMNGGDPFFQFTSGSINCTSFILVISLGKRLILFAQFLLRPFQRLYLSKSTLWNNILSLLLNIF